MCKHILFFITIVLLTSSFSNADDIYLKNRFVIKNCQVIDTVGNQIRIMTTDGEEMYFIALVKIIEFIPFNPAIKTTLVDTDARFIEKPPIVYDNKPKKQDTITEEEKYYYPNINLLPVSIISFALAYDNFSEISQLDKAIDNFKILKLDTSELESTKGKKMLLGGIFILIGVANLGFVAQEVEIKAMHNSLSIVYNF